MARGKQGGQQLTQRKQSATPSPAAPTPAPRPKRIASPLPFGHYLPRIPLQLAAVFFSFLAATSTPDSEAVGPLSRPFSRILNSLISDPPRTLPIACAALSVVQAWFGIWARSCRSRADKLAKSGGKDDKEEVVPKRERKTTSQIFGEMWKKALSGKAPHYDLLDKAMSANAKKNAPKIDIDFIAPAVATTLMGAAGLHVCAVLLGAPLLSNFPETALLSLLVSILAILPLAIALPVLLSPVAESNRYVWLRFFSSVSANDDLELALLAPAFGAILGCWLGAVPIPLDWDRPWQVWPTTCVVGALLGHVVGSVTSLAITGFRTAARTAEEALEANKLQ